MIGCHCATRRSRTSVERQVAQWQPIIGTPCDVPVPSMVTRAAIGALTTLGPGRLNPSAPVGSGRDNPRLRLGGFDEAQAQLVEDLLEQLPLFRGQVAARLRF